MSITCEGQNFVFYRVARLLARLVVLFDFVPVSYFEKILTHLNERNGTRKFSGK